MDAIHTVRAVSPAEEEEGRTRSELLVPLPTQGKVTQSENWAGRQPLQSMQSNKVALAHRTWRLACAQSCWTGAAATGGRCGGCPAQCLWWEPGQALREGKVHRGRGSCIVVLTRRCVLRSVRVSIWARSFFGAFRVTRGCSFSLHVLFCWFQVGRQTQTTVATRLASSAEVGVRRVLRMSCRIGDRMFRVHRLVLKPSSSQLSSCSRTCFVTSDFRWNVGPTFMMLTAFELEHVKGIVSSRLALGDFSDFTVESESLPNKWLLEDYGYRVSHGGRLRNGCRRVRAK